MPVYPSGGTIAQSVGSPGFGPAPTPSYNASASVRFNPADSANISFTPTLQGSRATWTMAFWFKRSSLSSRQLVVANLNSAGTIGFGLELNASDQLDIYDYNGSAYTMRLITTQVFRDPAQWYHLTLAFDSTQATSSNRLKLYINGVQVTAFGTATYPSQYYSGYWNQSGVLSTIGKAGSYTSGTTFFYGGYLADVNFVDGLALTPSSFTSTDANTGQLAPIQYTGAFGVNGFYLPFSGAALAVDLGQNPKTTAQDYPYWPTNTLLVNTTSTNGQQNNTFLDSSTNNFTITRNGNTTQGNFTPFNYGGGTTQANGYYSGYFDGTGDYLTAPYSALLDITQGNFTVEAWVYRNVAGALHGIITQRPNSAAQQGWDFRINAANTLQLYYTGGSSVTSAATILANVWTHVAATRSGGTVYLFINGALVTSSAFSNGTSAANTTLTVVAAENDFSGTMNGYISNLRVVNGTAVYTSNFTPPTAPLTAISGTQLLTCQSSQFIDNSTNSFAITTVGNSQPVPANPFGMTDWSTQFNGTGSYLNMAASTGFDFGTGDFTVETWVNYSSGVAAGGTTRLPFFFCGGIASAGNTVNWEFWFDSSTNKLTFDYWDGGSFAVGASSNSKPLAANTWHHVAATRSSGVLRIFLNGSVYGTDNAFTKNINLTQPLYLGRAEGGTSGGTFWYANMVLSNSRIVKGTALYTTNFIPPTAPLTAVSGTVLLTNQSSTVVDNSSVGRTITVNGSTSPITLSNPFNNNAGNTPPVQAWSNYFEGTSGTVGGGLTFPSSSNYAMGFGDFTVEGWYFPNRAADATTPLSIAWYIGTINGAGTIGGGVATNQIHYRANGSTNQITVVTNVTGWNHVAWVRQDGVTYVYLNGSLIASAGNNFSATAGALIVARPGTDTFRFSGWISNMRVIKGRAIYTTNFTPPTAPLTAISGTVLLTCQSNNYADNSPFRAAPTINTPASISPSSPFFPTQAYSAASYGGTMYFDGTGDYLSFNGSTGTTLSGDFTFESWVYLPSVSATAPIMCIGDSFSNPGILFYINSSGRIAILRANAAVLTGSTSLVANTWNHVAFVRSSSTITGYLNGASQGTFTSSSTFSGTTTLIGRELYNGGLGAQLNGYISNLRIVNGTALYTTPFVPPVLPPTAVANTSLLLNATNAGIYDASGDNVIETVGNAQVSTAVKKWGETSVFFDGSGDYLLIPSTNAPTQFGSQDFTIEMWIYSTSIGNQQMIFSNRVASTGNTHFDWQIFTSKLYWGTTSTNICVGVTTLSSNTWYHVAVSRVSGTTRQFVNGVLDVSSTTSYTLSGNAITNIGTNGTHAPTQYPFVGYIQDVRVSKGVGRYSGNFTPPAAAFAYNQYDIGNQQWTPNNISVTAGVGKDNLVDSPSDYGTDTGLGGQVRGNYCTLSPLSGDTNAVLSNGNLTVSGGTSSGNSRYGTFGVSSGKWYWEYNMTIIGVNGQLAGATTDITQTTGLTGVKGYYFNGNKYDGATPSAYGATFTTGDVIGVALDMDAGTITFYKNGVSQGVAFSGLTGTYFPLARISTSVQGDFNFGQRAFSYAAPAGFKCLVSTNLPTTNNIGASSSTQANKYFNANTWTGNGTQIPVGFDPALLWYKSTNAISFGGWVDQIRGDNYYMQTWDTLASTLSSGLLTTNSTGFVPGSAFAANTYVSYGWSGEANWSWNFNGSLERTATMTIASPCVVTLASNGFSAGQAIRFTTTGTLPTGVVAGTTYYAGNISSSTFNLYDTEANAITGGATGRVDTSGSQSGTHTCEHAAKVNANPTSGFSVTQYIGIGANTTIPHGLGAAPELWFIKCSGTVGNWYAFTTALDGSVDYTYLNGQQNLTNASAGYTTLPTSTVVSIGADADSNTNGVTYMLYSYVSIPGFSKVGVYTGNGAADGPMIYTNFSPEMMLLKRVSGTPIDNWYNLDVPRSPYNVVSNYLSSNSSAVQGTATFVDFLSNGFKVRAAGAYENASGSSYLYFAVASAPFKYSRAY